MKASAHPGPNYNEKLEVYKNTNFEELKNLFDITTIDWRVSSWTRSTVMHDQVIEWTKAKVHVYTESVLW